MKKLSFLALAAAGLLFAACSDKDEVAQNVVNPDEYEDGAYIGISLSLPSADNKVTRANDDLSNGIEDEFKVKNATLYIFSGTSEANAVYVDYVSLGTKYNPDTQGGINPDEWGVQNGVGTKPVDDTDAATEPDAGETNITSTSLNEATRISNELAAEIKASTKNYYAYVIINHNGQIPAMTKGTTTFQEFSRTKFDKIGADIALEQNIWSDGMLMTNAPISNVSGGAAAPSSPTYSTLVPLDKNKIFSSVAQAKAEPAACVYVERAAVKITVEQGSGVASSLIDGYSVNLNGWKVINTEPQYYNTRQINYSATENGSSPWATEDWGGYTNPGATPTSALYRFVSFYQFLPTLPSGLKDGYTHTTGFRTYFAADPHYDVDAQAEVTGASPVPSTLKFTTADDARPWIAAGKHAYTTENTFDVKHQTWRNTTMVTVKAQLAKTGVNPDFYTVGKGGQTMYTKTDAQNELHNRIWNDPTVATKLSACMTELAADFPGETIAPVLTVTLADVTTATTGVGVTRTLSFTHNGTAVPTTYESETNYTALIAAINTYLAKDDALVSFYKSGEMYYNIKIQHFGEIETPWGGGDVVAGGSGVNVNEIYFKTPWDGTPDATAITTGQSKFLGRYGVVRDNWYKLEINGVTKIGSATPQDPSLINPDTPDDEIENYLSVHVHIVPWVLRSQTVTL